MMNTKQKQFCAARHIQRHLLVGLVVDDAVEVVLIADVRVDQPSRTARREPLSAEKRESAEHSDYASSLLLTLTNPTTVLSITELSRPCR